MRWASALRHDGWLTAPAPPNDLLRPYPVDLTAAFPVNTLVNRPKNEDPRWIEPIEGF